MKPLLWIPLLAGFGDFLTGVFLILFPEWTLEMMWIKKVPLEKVYIQFIGSFVAGVGLSYLFSYFQVLLKGKGFQTLRGLFYSTTLIRFSVSSVLLWVVLRGTMDVAWLSVCFYDSSVAAYQVYLLKKGFLEGE